MAELASVVLVVLIQRNQETITKNLGREYETLKTLKKNVPPETKLLFGDDCDIRIKLLQVSNKT